MGRRFPFLDWLDAAGLYLLEVFLWPVSALHFLLLPWANPALELLGLTPGAMRLESAFVAALLLWCGLGISLVRFLQKMIDTFRQLRQTLRDRWFKLRLRFRFTKPALYAKLPFQSDAPTDSGGISEVQLTDLDLDVLHCFDAHASQSPINGKTLIKQLGLDRRSVQQSLQRLHSLDLLTTDSSRLSLSSGFKMSAAGATLTAAYAKRAAA